MKTRLLLFFALTFLGTSIAGFAKAVCPVCVVAVSAGLGLSKWLGVDDVVSSIWIGGFLWAVSAWTVEWIRKRNWGFKYDSAVSPAVWYLFALVPLYYAGIIGHSLNTIWGVDKIIFGVIVGTLVFIGANLLHKYLKIKNGGKSYFPYQKIVAPFLALLIFSLIFYFFI